jgi:diadenosine tetraphosphatase ApaH/serine/threonine PP2A family protein phosphatase
MTVAILSDVHGNLEALTAVLEDLDRQSISRVLFLGDVVGYGADPEPCLALLETRVHRSIAGNHDRAAANDQESLSSFTDDAAAAIRWTREVMTREARERLLSMPLEWAEDGRVLIHGSPYRLEEWQYVMSQQDADKAFSVCDRRLIFVGHSHVPAAYVEVECKRLFTGVMRKIDEPDPGSVKVESAYRYLLNVGSVGQPRDGDPRACYATYDEETGAFRLHRIPYDVKRASDKIRKAGLPENLAERLKSGT